MDQKIKFVCNAVKWFDKVNGNTYHSVRVTRLKDNKVIVNDHGFVYGYDDAYRQTALKIMHTAGWIPAKYKDQLCMYERENKRPIYWSCSDGLKRDMIANGKI